MSVYKGLIGGSAALCAVGLLLRLLGVSFGTDLMVLAVLGAVIAQAFAQRTTQNVLATTRRNLTQRLKELDEAQSSLREAVDELTTLQRTTLWYVKNRPGSSAPAADLGGSRPRSALRTGTAGRSSTPDVTNAAADLSFAAALEDRGPTRVSGLLAPRSREALLSLPGGADAVAIDPFLPGRALESLEAAEDAPQLVVLDEAAFATGPWDRAAGPTGIAMMRDLLAAVRRAHDAGVRVVLLPHAGVPDVHSRALRDSAAVLLPLTEDLREQASGAPLDPALDALDHLARDGSPL